MKKEWQDIISGFLGVQPIKINSASVSAQNRERLYWTNIASVTQPADTGVVLRSILQTQYDGKYLHSVKAREYMDRQVKGGRTHWDFAHHSDADALKSRCITAAFAKGVPYNTLIDGEIFRRFTPLECERLQTLPEGYTAGIPDTAAYKAIGNGWNVDTLMNIFKNI